MTLVPPAGTPRRAACRQTIGAGAAAAVLLGTLIAPAHAAPAPVSVPATQVQVFEAPVHTALERNYPTAAEIKQAKESAAATAAEVAGIEQLLAAAQTDLATAQVTALEAQASYNEALIILQERKDTAAAAQAEADAAAELYKQTQSDVGELAGDLYRNGGVTPGLTSLLVGAESSENFLYKASTMRALAANRSQTLTEAETAAGAWTSLQGTASAAQAAADEAASTANAARKEAEAAAEAQAALVAESEEKRGIVIQQLATLRDTTVKLESKRMAGIERKRQEEALAAAIAESAERAAQQAAEQDAAGQGQEDAGAETQFLTQQVDELSAGESSSPAPVSPVPAPEPDRQRDPAPKPRPVEPRPEPKPEPKPVEPKPAEPKPAPPPAPVTPTPPRPKPEPAPPAPPAPGFSTGVMVNYAMSKVGSGHYQWGGTGPLGFDCSGLIQQAFRAAGKNIPRGGTQQFFAAPTRVPLSQARYGDIIAFNYNGSGFSHVGIYLGNNRIVHALNPGQGIRVNHLSDLVGLNIHYQAARY